MHFFFDVLIESDVMIPRKIGQKYQERNKGINRDERETFFMSEAVSYSVSATCFISVSVSLITPFRTLYFSAPSCLKSDENY